MVFIHHTELISRLCQEVFQLEASKKSSERCPTTITFLVEYELDSLLSWVVFAHILKQLLDIPCVAICTESVAEAESLGRLIRSKPDENIGPLLILGFDKYLAGIVTAHGDSKIFHIARDFKGAPDDGIDDGNDQYLLVRNRDVTEECSKLFEVPLVLTQIALSLMSCQLDRHDYRSLISIVAASSYHRGCIDIEMYKRCMNACLSSELFNENSSHGIERITRADEIVHQFPGLFFYYQSMSDNVELSPDMQRALSKLHIEAKETELSSVRVTLGMTTEEWYTPFSQLSVKRQALVFEKLKGRKIIEYDICDRGLPVMIIQRKRGMDKDSTKMHRLTNFDMAFLFDSELTASKFLGRDVNGGEETETKINLILKASLMSSSALRFRTIFEAFEGTSSSSFPGVSNKSYDTIREQGVNRAITAYRKLGDRFAAIFSLLNERVIRNERSMSSAFQTSYNLHVFYVTESAYLPLNLFETKFVNIRLGTLLQSSKTANILMIQAGHSWSKLSWRTTASVNSMLINEVIGPLKLLASQYLVDASQVSGNTVNLLVDSDRLWQLFSKIFNKTMKNKGSRTKKDLKKRRGGGSAAGGEDNDTSAS